MGKDIIEQLRTTIRRAEKRGISQYRLAEIAGVHRGQITRLMHGTVAPRLDTAEKIARAAGCEVVVRSIRR